MTQESFLPYSHQSINSADIDAVSSALKEDWITRGSQVEAFENEIASYCGATYAVAFSSGSAALAGAFYAAAVSPHDRVITSPNTFIASVGTAIPFGATPVFVDIDRNTGNADIEHLAATANQPASRKRPIIVPVHFAGIPVDMQQLDQRLTVPDVVIIEDAAHAIGSRYSVNGPRVGSCEWSHMTMFSFHPAKTITTAEGGLVTTNEKELARRLRLFRNNCMERDPEFLQGEAAPWYYEVVGVSNNYNFTEMQAALGRSQLKRIESFIDKRRILMKAYRKELANIPYLRLFTDEFDDHTAFHLCVVQIDFNAIGTTRTALMNKLKEKGIGTQLHYIPLYRHPCMVEICGEIADYFPQMEAYYAQALSLPLYYDLTIEDVKKVSQALKTL
jgi:UDP-4-amino-4,6-dideoxy-L-N-acetyl-beta-L-altrosamine transaminase